jgi:hypothetical protein
MRAGLSQRDILHASAFELLTKPEYIANYWDVKDRYRRLMYPGVQNA